MKMSEMKPRHEDCGVFGVGAFKNRIDHVPYIRIIGRLSTRLFFSLLN